MGRYLTVPGFISQFGEDEARQVAGSGTWNTAEGVHIDEDQIEKAIAWSDQLIDGHLLQRHVWLADTDVTEIPDLLSGLAGDISRYRLRNKAGGSGEISDTVITRYKEAIRTLEQIRDGKIALPHDFNGDGDPDLTANDASSAKISGPHPKSHKILAGYDG